MTGAAAQMRAKDDSAAAPRADVIFTVGRVGNGEPCEWSMVVHGEPVAKGRARHSTKNGHVRTYTPEKTRSYEAMIRHHAAFGWGRRPLLDGMPIDLVVDVYRAIPESWSAKRKIAAACGQIKPISKPDWDNCGKIASDALNGVVLRDDAMITAALVRKHYAINPRLEITIRWHHEENPNGRR